MQTPAIDPHELFHSLNEQFFEGKLPDYRIEFAPQSRLQSDDPETGGEHVGKERKILLAEALRLKPEGMRRMLIHEMVHADTGDEHDERFFDKLVEIARTGEEWAWDEAREYHPCTVKTMIHWWRACHPSLKISHDPRTTCGCKACAAWVEQGSPVSESIEDWHPWATSDAPDHIRLPLPDPMKKGKKRS